MTYKVKFTHSGKSRAHITSAKRGSKLEVCYQCGEKHDYLHLIDLGRVGYGSMLDGCQVSIPICDECLYNFVMGLKLKDRVLNSGSNYGYDELQKAYQRVKL